MLAFIPKLFETPDNWQSTVHRTQIPLKSILTFDLSGHLPSATAIISDEWLEQCATRLDERAPDGKTILVCHSIGGLLGLRMFTTQAVASSIADKMRQTLLACDLKFREWLNKQLGPQGDNDVATHSLFGKATL
jgi:hypothetical protein